jgi:hypothetical protein
LLGAEDADTEAEEFAHECGDAEFAGFAPGGQALGVGAEDRVVLEPAQRRDIEQAAQAGVAQLAEAGTAAEAGAAFAVAGVEAGVGGGGAGVAQVGGQLGQEAGAEDRAARPGCCAGGRPAPAGPDPAGG